MITLEEVKARQTELAEMIASIERGSQGALLQLPETEIRLQPGERYAGTVLDEAGQIKHHLVLLATKPDGQLTWADAKTWAAAVGGELPTRQEQSLLFANCKDAFDANWYWSSEEHENASYAWSQHFYGGHQDNNRKSVEWCARAVRLIPISA